MCVTSAQPDEKRPGVIAWPCGLSENSIHEGRALPLLCLDLAHHRRSEVSHSGRRIPAGDLEGLVIERLRSFLADPAAILDALAEGSRGRFDNPCIIAHGRQMANELAAVAPDKVKATLMALGCRIEVGSDRVDIALSRDRLIELLAGSIELTVQQRRGLGDSSGDILKLTALASLQRVGRGMRMLVENADAPAAADASLLRILSRAHDVQARLIQNPNLTVHDVARDEKVSSAHLYTILRLAWLAPDITASIVNGRKPPQLTAKTLMRLTPRLPAEWAEQRKLLGFH
jgi:site-specific DNA recombinase